MSLVNDYEIGGVGGGAKVVLKDRGGFVDTRFSDLFYEKFQFDLGANFFSPPRVYVPALRLDPHGKPDDDLPLHMFRVIAEPPSVWGQFISGGSAKGELEVGIWQLHDDTFSLVTLVRARDSDPDGEPPIYVDNSTGARSTDPIAALLIACRRRVLQECCLFGQLAAADYPDLNLGHEGSVSSPYPDVELYARGAHPVGLRKHVIPDRRPKR